MSSEGEQAVSKLETKVEALKDEVQRLLEDSVAPNRLAKQKDLLAKATALRHIAAKLHEALEGEEGEGAITARLNKTENRLRELASSLEPDEVELDYLNSAKRGSIVTIKDDNVEENEDDDDDDDDDDEDDDEDDYDEDDDEDEADQDEADDVDINDEEEAVGAMASQPEVMDDSAQGEIVPTQEETLPSGIRACRAIYDFDPEQEGDLELKDGEIVKILSVRPDGWWEAENQWGKIGMIPSTFVRELRPEKVHRIFKDFNKSSPSPGGDGKQAWASLKSIVRADSTFDSSSMGSKKPTDMTSILRAMGSVPSGFRSSTLSAVASSGDHSAANFLFPALSASGLGFRDVKWDSSTNDIKASQSWVMRIMTLVQCKNVPPPGAGVEVLDRFARVCLFDGKNFFSNVHTVRADLAKLTDPTMWTFRASTLPNPSSTTPAPPPPPISDCPDIFLRTAVMKENLGVLVELCLTYQRTSTKEKGEMSCGWIHLPFMENHGAPLPSRNYELQLKGGTPFESGVGLDSSLPSRNEVNQSKWRNLISKSKAPTIIVRMAGPAAAVKEKISLLPETFIGSLTHLPLFVFYRQILADHLLRFRVNTDSAELFQDPFLRFFLRASSHNDVMEACRIAWAEAQKKFTRAEKKDAEFAKRAFKLTFIGVAAPVLMHVDDKVGEEASTLPTTSRIIPEVLSILSSKRAATASAIVSPAVALLSPNITFAPFDVHDIAVDLVPNY